MVQRQIVWLVFFIPGAVTAQEPKVGSFTKSEWLKMLETDTNPRKREGALVALGIMKLQSKSERGISDAFRQAMLKDKAEQVRLKALTLVRDWDKVEIRELVPTLAEVLKDDKSAAVRAMAASALGKAAEHAKPALPTMLEAVKDSDPAVQSAVADAIARLGEDAKSAVPTLIPLLKHTDAGVRLAAVFALGRVGSEGATAVDDMMRLLAEDPDKDVRRESARAFLLLGLEAKSALPALVKSIAGDKEEDVRKQSALAIAKMGSRVGPVAKELIAVLGKEPSKFVREAIVHSLGTSMGPGLKDHVKGLADHLIREAEGEVRLAIVQEIGALGPDGIDGLPALNRCLADVQVTVRDAAKSAVRRVTGKDKEPEKKG